MALLGSRKKETVDGRNPFATPKKLWERTHCLLVFPGESAFHGFLGGAGSCPPGLSLRVPLFRVGLGKRGDNSFLKTPLFETHLPSPRCHEHTREMVGTWPSRAGGEDTFEHLRPGRKERTQIPVVGDVKAGVRMYLSNAGEPRIKVEQRHG